MLRKIITLALVTGSLAATACNTVDGAKKDVNSAASATERATDGK